MNDRIVLTEKSKPFIDLKTFFKKTAACVGFRKRGQGVYVIGTVFQDAFEE
jgi:hypothetical protein